MATIWIREYGAIGRKGSAPIPQEPGVDQAPLTFSDSQRSAEFAVGTSYIGVIANAAFHYVVGAGSPTATTSCLKIPADTLYHVGVTPGQKFAVILAV